MKTVLLITSLITLTQGAFSQSHSEELPREFKKIAQQAFQQLSPVNRQWFTETAKQQIDNKFDTAWARKKIKERFGANASDNVGELFAVMLAYQKLLAKEEREDKKIKDRGKDITIQSKDEKLKLENKRIDEMKREADEKADQQMDAAQTQMWIGIVTGFPAGASAGNSQKQLENSTVDPNQVVNPVVTKQTDSLKAKMSTMSDQKEKNEKGKTQARAMDDAVTKLKNQMSIMSKYISL